MHCDCLIKFELYNQLHLKFLIQKIQNYLLQPPLDSYSFDSLNYKNLM